MTITRISALAVALLLLLAVACSSEDPAKSSPTESPQVVSAQPSTAPSPTSASAASSSPTEPLATATAEPEEQDLKIVTLLPFDAIPAVLDPVFIGAEEAEAELAKRNDNPDDALVLGLSINGDSRAYYVPSLSAVEIVNDTVGGQPLAVTW